MTNSPVLDSAGRRRSPATMPGFHAGRPPRNKGMHYPADPPTVEEIVAVMRARRQPPWLAAARDDRVLWRGGLRVQEALALTEHDLDPRRGRCSCATARAAAAARSAWTPGDGSNCVPGSQTVSSYRSGRCSA